MLVVDASDRILSHFPEPLSRRAARQLVGLGVTTMERHTVVDVKPTAVTVRSRTGQEQRIEARTVVWAAGVRASSLAAKLASASGGAVDRAGASSSSRA